jgi:hypothetical protein
MVLPPIKDLIKKVDYEGLREALSKNPGLANEPIPLDDNPATAHPLHRICDGVFNEIYSDKEAAEMATIFLEFGAKVNGSVTAEKKDTPLIAAASLQADEVALLYIDHGANIHHAGCHGGTALHWAAWCGRDRVVKRLISEKAPLEKKCIDFKGTPLLWAVHGYKFGGRKNRHRQIECVRILLYAGAHKNVANAEGTLPAQFLSEEDIELKNLLTN